MFRRDIEDEILPYTIQHGIGVLVYGPLAHGLLTGTMTPQSTFSADDWRSRSPDFSGDTFRRNLEVVDKLKGPHRPGPFRSHSWQWRGRWPTRAWTRPSSALGAHRIWKG